MDLAALTDALLAAARAGAEAARAGRTRAAISFKPTKLVASPLAVMARRIVTDADLAAQEAVLRRLLDAGLAACRLVAEEDTPSVAAFRGGADAPVLFVDPIDGTLTYALGCPGFESAALAAGFPRATLDAIRAGADPRLYGQVLGAFVPGAGHVALCGLPELGIVYRAAGGAAFRNGAPLRYAAPARPTRVVVGPRLLDPDGAAATPFHAAGLDIALAGSHPAALWRIFERDCTAYAGTSNSYDGQLTSVVARAAGLLVTDRRGRDFTPADLDHRTDSIVFAATRAEQERIAAVLCTYP